MQFTQAKDSIRLGLHVAGLAAVLLAVACSSGQESDSGSQAASEAGRGPGDAPGLGGDADVQARLDALRALPYAGTVTETIDVPVGENPIKNAAAMQPGYTLYSVYKLCVVALVDERGRPARTWHHPCRRFANAELLPDGDLLLVGVDPTPDHLPPREIDYDAHRFAIRFDFDGNIEWKTTLTAHHDIEEIPSGDLLTVSYRRLEGAPESPDVEIRDEMLTLLDPDGRVKAKKSIYEMIKANPGVFPLQPVEKARKGSHQYRDLFHANSVEWMPHPHLEGRDPIYDASNVIVSFRHQDRIAIFNWKHEKVVWSWGQGELLGPHDAQYLPNGNVLVFDNGLGREWSRVIELDPIEKKIVWEYGAPDQDVFYTASKGAAQVLPNGNVLIAHSSLGRGFEITRDGEIVWDFYSPYEDEEGERGTIVRMKRYDRAFIERLLGKR